MENIPMMQLVLATATQSGILFIWSGVSQILPWGVPTARQIISTELVAPRFEQELVNTIATLTTERTFSWIITKPLSYYNMTRYFVLEFLTQLGVGLLLTFILALTSSLPLGYRLALVSLGALAAVTGTYGQQLNWWGMPFRYGLGASLNLVVGWLMAAFVTAQWILPSF